MQSKTRLSQQQTKVMLLLCSLSMITYLDRVCFGASAQYIVRDLGLAGVADLKWAFTAFAIAYAIFEIPCGWMGDRFGPRSTLLRIVLWWSAFTMLTGCIGLKLGSWTFGGLATLFVLRFLFGAGEAGAYPNITRAIHNWFPRIQWDRAQSLIWMSGRLMGGLTPLFWTILVAGSEGQPGWISWRAAFGLFGAVGVVWCMVFLYAFRDGPEERWIAESESEFDRQGMTSDHASEPISTPWRAILSNRSLWALCSMYFLLNYGWSFNITYLPSYLETRFHPAEGDLIAALYKGAPLWIGAVGCFLGGVSVMRASRWLGDPVIGRRFVAMVALSICAALWVGAVMAENMHWFIVCVGGAAFCIDMTLGAAWASCQDLGRRHAAVVAATMNTVGTLGSALAAWLTGTLVERSVEVRAAEIGQLVEIMDPAEKSGAMVAGFQNVFVTYAAVYVVAVLCWLWIHPAPSTQSHSG